MCQNPSYESQFQEGKPQQENVFIWFTPDTSNLIPVQTIKKIQMIICKSSLNGLKPYVKSICKSFIWLPFIHVIQFWITRLWIIPAEVEKDEKGRRPSGASNQGARRATPQPGSEQILWWSMER